MRCIDKRIEESAIYIKWDDTPEDEWLIGDNIKVINASSQKAVIARVASPEEVVIHL